MKTQRRLKVVADCSNGTAGLVLRQIFQNSNVKAILINAHPDGNFPAHGPDPLATKARDELKKSVKKNRADLGFIFDADADRIFFVDDRGEDIPSDAVASLITRSFKGPVILDVRAGYLAKELIAAQKKKIIESPVGHYFIKKLMAKKHIKFAAETSGHYYFSFPRGAYFDSAILTAIYMMKTLGSLTTRSLSEWLKTLPKYYHSGELNFQVKNKTQTMKRVESHYRARANKISKLDGLKMIFDSWWFILRPSNTENLIRLNLESKDKQSYRKALKQIKKLISR